MEPVCYFILWSQHGLQKKTPNSELMIWDNK